ncbi:hypothetical protein M3Y94_00717500 [Aphelenchoides besseyi]|nr:hypothetical protein M3Y94_00717500 [Aphelenchoides besseyi]KAI6231772.1 hypothetical protein M3Y95_00416800 [Aphelenchoides besseyi]
MMSNNHSDGQSAALELRDRLLARHRQEHVGVKGYLEAEEQGIRSMIKMLIPHYYSPSSNERTSNDTKSIRVPTPHPTEKPSSSQQVTAEQKKSIDGVDLKISGSPYGARIRTTVKPNRTLRMKIHVAKNSNVKVVVQLSDADFQPNPEVGSLQSDKSGPQGYCVSHCECSKCIDVPLNKFKVNESDNQIGLREQAPSMAETTDSTLRNVQSLPLQLTDSLTFVSQSKK